MSDTRIWLVIAGLGVVTYAIRFSFLGLLGGRALPPVVTRGLAFVPVTVLPALILPLLLRSPEGAFEADPVRLVAAGAALAAGVIARSVLPALAVGFAVFLALGRIL